MTRTVVRRRLAATWLALCALCVSAPAQAEFRALLIGVSGYPTLPAHYRLEGPRNDVLRMRQVLQLRGFQAEHIEVLADGIPGAGSPTRANILRALDRLADVARPGDTVFVQFAGHGSQQPADRSTPAGRDESDGLHETFLPIDVGAWDGAALTVANAIVNFELRAAIDRISDRGAFVWGVFDACHSATLVRGANDTRVRYRNVDPRDLGLRPEDMQRAAGAASRTRGGPAPRQGALGAPRGSSAFFYATQTTELAPEMPLPIGSPDRRPYGLFDFMVAKALEHAQAISYRQLAQSILAEYGAIVEAHATPLFTGNGLDTLVLGQASIALRQWPLQPGRTLRLPAGTLSGIEVGAVLAVVPGPLSRDADAIGHLQVASAQIDASELVPVAHAGRPAPAPAELREGMYARLVSSPPQFALRVGFDKRPCPSDNALCSAIEALQRQGVSGVEAVWTGPLGGADIVIRQVGDRVVFLAPNEPGDNASLRTEPLGLALRVSAGPVSPAALAEQVAANLHRIARSRNLLRIAAGLAADRPANGLGASLRRVKGAGAAPPITPDTVPDLHDGDQLSLKVENRGDIALDVTLLYLDAEYGITALFPTPLGESNRLEAGASREIDQIDIHGSPAGLERLLLIAVPAAKLGERSDFSFLQQPTLPRQRSAAPSDDFDLFVDAAFAEHRQRGASRAAAPNRATMQVFTVKVGP